MYLGLTKTLYIWTHILYVVENVQDRKYFAPFPNGVFEKLSLYTEYRSNIWNVGWCKSQRDFIVQEPQNIHILSNDILKI